MAEEECGDGTLRYSSGFQEHQRDLCLLSSFINEQEQWLEALLGRLGWNKEGLKDNVKSLHPRGGIRLHGKLFALIFAAEPGAVPRGQEPLCLCKNARAAQPAVPVCCPGSGHEGRGREREREREREDQYHQSLASF